MTDEPPQAVPTESVRAHVKKHEDYTTLYANGLYMEPSAWDLRIQFGELDQSTGEAIVELHTGMNIPWSMAKILHFLLEANILAYEALNGKIKIPANAIPMIPEPPDDSPRALEMFEHLKSMREKFLSSSEE